MLLRVEIHPTVSLRSNLQIGAGPSLYSRHDARHGLATLGAAILLGGLPRLFYPPTKAAKKFRGRANLLASDESESGVWVRKLSLGVSSPLSDLSQPNGQRVREKEQQL